MMLNFLNQLKFVCNIPKYFAGWSLTEPFDDDQLGKKEVAAINHSFMTKT